ncbi:hypothetical protein QFC24_000716 [Naganishia onofrii]|uniref:Uncharacterized protein n=1 Tax=Naganishia onofrii TaxID=1851511 RepID=A0ACC2XV02_9TREE|nr:hypothetical protein QFC24_000716 [Naganishia onofrii]
MIRDKFWDLNMYRYPLESTAKADLPPEKCKMINSNPPRERRCGDLIINKPVSIDTIQEFLAIPLWFQSKAEDWNTKHELGKVELISAIKFRQNGAILPSASPPFWLHQLYQRKHKLETLELDFDKGSTEDEGFIETAGQAFRFVGVDTYDPWTATRGRPKIAPRVVVNVQDGWYGLRQFVKAVSASLRAREGIFAYFLDFRNLQLDGILSDCPTCLIILRVAASLDEYLPRGSVSDDDDDAPRHRTLTPLEWYRVEFTATMITIARLYCKHWLDMRENWEAGSSLGQPLFDLEIKFASSDNSGEYLPLRLKGFVEDDSDSFLHIYDGEVALWVAAACEGDDEEEDTELLEERYVL